MEIIFHASSHHKRDKHDTTIGEKDLKQINWEMKGHRVTKTTAFPKRQIVVTEGLFSGAGQLSKREEYSILPGTGCSRFGVV